MDACNARDKPHTTLRSWTTRGRRDLKLAYPETLREEEPNLHPEASREQQHVDLSTSLRAAFRRTTREDRSIRSQRARRLCAGIAQLRAGAPAWSRGARAARVPPAAESSVTTEASEANLSSTSYCARISIHWYWLLCDNSCAWVVTPAKWSSIGPAYLCSPTSRTSSAESASLYESIAIYR